MTAVDSEGVDHRGGSADPRLRHRLRLTAVCAALAALAFIQDPGRIAADTKLDLAVDPAGFLARSLSLWEPLGFFGQLQNQAYGYLFPMGPFYVATEAVGMPAWVAQRLWWSLLLITAFLGTVRLARLLGIEASFPRILAGLAYALAPRMVTELGVLSVEVLPFALAPWVIVPLASAAQGRRSLRKAAALSGLAVLACGGVNAVATFAVLPMAAWWILTRYRGSACWRLLGWWSLCVVLATAWWAIPLAVLGRYSPPFLDWIESSSVTTLITAPDTVLRGTSQWVAYVADPGGPVWPGGWQLVASPWLILAVGIVSTAGLVGLALPSTPWRLFLVGSLVGGWTLVSLGHVGAWPGVQADVVRDLLDGVLAPLRNTHKFDLLLRLPLALGVGYAVAALARAGGVDAGRRRVGAPSEDPDRGNGSSPSTRARRAVAGLGVTAIALALVASAWPAVTGSLTRDRSFVGIPEYWSEAARWLADNSADGRALLVPGASFGIYSWGRTQDEPLQALAASPWAVRDAVPLSSAGNIRWLDAVQERLDSGRGSAGLADALARAGVRYVVVRNDIDRRRSDSPRSSLLRQALVRSGGFAPVAGFGPVLPPYRTETTVVDGGLQEAAVAVEVWEVSSPYAAPDPRVSLRPLDGSALLASGSAEGVLELADAGVLGARAVITEGDAVEGAVPQRSGITDGFRRTEVNVGRARDNRSQTFTVEDSFQQDRRVADYLPVDPAGRQAVAEFTGGVARASSSGADADSLRGRSSAAQPWAAIDGDPQTAWVSGDLEPGVGQWWEIRSEEAFDVPAVEVRLLVGDVAGTTPARITVSTDAGERTVDVLPTDQPQTVPLPPGPTRTLRLTLAGVADGGAGEGFGLREVEVPVDVVRRVVTAGDSDGGPIVLSARGGSRSGCVVADAQIVCDESLVRAGEEQTGVFRVISVDAQGEYRVRIQVRPRPGERLDGLLAPVAGDAVIARASGVQVSDPAVRPQAAVDGSLETAWVANPLDPRPELTLEWPEPRRVTGVQLITRPALPTSRPLTVTATVDGLETTSVVTNSGYLRLPPREATSVTLRFDNASIVRSLDPLTGAYAAMPVGITEVRVLGAGDREAGPRPGDEAAVPCGFGPALVLDGTVATRTEVTARVGDVLTDGLLEARPCEGRLITLSPGRHVIDVASTAEFVVERVILDPLGAPGLPLTAQSPEVVSWNATQRVVDVPAADGTRLLETSENYSAGWRASLGGAALTPVRVDGWRQAWVIPAGAAGTVDMEFAPQATYRAGLIAGLAAVVALLVLAFWPRRAAPGVAQRDGSAGPAATQVGTLVIGVGALVAAVLVAGLWGLLVAVAAMAVARVTGRPLLVAIAGGAAAVLAALVPWPARLAADPAILALLAALAVSAIAATAAPWPWPGRSTRSTGPQPRGQQSDGRDGG